MDAAALEPGTSIRTVCPFCGGGRSGEASMVLSHADDGALLFVCHRAHCGASGRLGGGAVLRRPERRETVIRTYDGLRAELPEETQGLIRERWHFGRALPPTWAWSGTRLLMPVRGPQREHRGWLARALDDRKPKVLTYREVADGAFVHWAGNPLPGIRIVVVEDIPSAERLGMLGYWAVALLGTHMNDEAQREIVSQSLRFASTVTVALDRDASNKTLAYAQALRWHTAALALLIDKDFKDMTDSEVLVCMSVT